MSISHLLPGYMVGLYFSDPFGLDGVIWLILANEMWEEAVHTTSKLKHLTIGMIILKPPVDMVMVQGEEFGFLVHWIEGAPTYL